MRLPFEEPVELSTDLAVDEVYLRLSASVVSRYAFFKSRRDHPVAGVVKRDRCWLQARTFYSNSFQRLLHLRYIPEASRTRLVGAFAPHRAVFVFMTIWFGFLAFFSVVWVAGFIRGGIWLFDASSGPQGRQAEWPWVFFPFGMMLFGVVLVRFGVWLSRRTEPNVIEFVEQTLRGRLASGQDGSTEEPEVFIRPRHESPERDPVG